MSQPFTVDVPHALGAAEARRRVEGNLHKLSGKLPAGATVTPAWDGDRLQLDVAIMGQTVGASMDILDNLVRITVALPPALAFFRQAIEAGLRKGGGALLEDRT